MPFIACHTNTQQKPQTTKTNPPQPAHHKNRQTTQGGSKKPTPPTQPPTAQHGTRHKGASEDARVHYPLHKQPTHQHPPPSTHTGTTRTDSKGGTKKPPHPTRHPHGTGTGGPDSSEPQQCANHPTTTTPARFHTPEQDPGVVLRPAAAATGSFADDSTSEHHQCHPHGRRARRVCAP